MSEFLKDGLCIIYRGFRFRKQANGRYFVADSKIIPERLLHRYVWHCEFGKIGDGMHIHHKDENIHNNNLDNLQEIDSKKHQQDHMVDRWASDDSIAFNIGLVKAREAAKEWHASAEGEEWHKKQGKENWVNKKYYDAICQLCGATYKTPFPTRSRFCSRPCITKNANSSKLKKK